MAQKAQEAGLSFDANFDVMFDEDYGITRVGSGTAPYHPDQVRVAVRNVDYASKPTKEQEQACINAAKQGEAVLKKWIRANCIGDDERARDQLASALGDFDRDSDFNY